MDGSGYGPAGALVGGSTFVPLTREALQRANLDSSGACLSPLERMRRRGAPGSAICTALAAAAGGEGPRGLVGFPAACEGGAEQPAYVEEPSWAAARCSRSPRYVSIDASHDAASSVGRSVGFGAFAADSPEALLRGFSAGASVSFHESREGTAGQLSEHTFGAESVSRLSSWRSSRSVSVQQGCRSRKVSDDPGYEVSHSNSWRTVSQWSSPYGVVPPSAMAAACGSDAELVRADTWRAPQAIGHVYHDPATAPAVGGSRSLPTRFLLQQEESPFERRNERSRAMTPKRRSFPSMIPEELERESSTLTAATAARGMHGEVSRPLDSTMEDAVAAADAVDLSTTTLMIKHLPKGFNRAKLCELMDDFGLTCMYDFVYLPVKFSSNTTFGYAFVNFVDSASARRCQMVFDGYTGWEEGDDDDEEQEPCEVSLNTKHRGLEACIGLYRNSPVMHPSVPDEVKPAIFKQGVPMPFPPPTRKIKPPRARAVVEGADGPPDA